MSMNKPLCELPSYNTALEEEEDKSPTSTLTSRLLPPPPSCISANSGVGGGGSSTTLGGGRWGCIVVAPAGIRSEEEAAETATAAGLFWSTAPGISLMLLTKDFQLSKFRRETNIIFNRLLLIT